MEEKLKDLLNLHSVKEIRGRGLMWGIELNGIKAREIQEELIERGILVLSAGENVLRLLPPLIITKEELEMGIENIKDVLQKRC